MAFSFMSTPQQQTSSLFQSQPQLFQQGSPLFSQPQQQPQQQQLQLQFPQQQQQPQFQLQQQQQQQQQFYLFTGEKAPATYSTKWADLHPDSQKILLQIEERILEYRDESKRLDQCNRLYDSSVSNEGFELDASQIVQELGGISTSMERQKALLQELMANIKEMLRNTEMAVRSFMMLRPRFLHPNAGGTSNATAPSQSSGTTVTPGSTGQPAPASIIPVFDFYSGLPKKPSPFLQQTVARFEKYLAECSQWIEELEQLLLLDSDRNSSCSRSSLLQSLPKVMLNVHDFFVHVAAKVDGIHQYVESMKTAYLVDQRRQGDGNDPFLEADRRERAKQEAAAKRVHPTLHLPASSHPSTQGAGLFASSATPMASTAPQATSATTPAASGSALSLFSTPSSGPSSSVTPLFGTPTTSALASSLFATMSGASSLAQPHGSASTRSLFASTTPAFSTGASLFSTPLFGGAATGSGQSFSGPPTTKPSRPKSRNVRR